MEDGCERVAKEATAWALHRASSAAVGGEERSPTRSTRTTTMTRTLEARAPRDWRRWRRPATHVVLSMVAIGAIALAATQALEEPLRGAVVRAMNAQLSGYRVHIAEVDLHPLGLAIDFEGLTVTPQARAEPPVLAIPRVTASVQWRALLRGEVVADFLLERPAVHIDLRDIERESEDNFPVQERGWQDAVGAMYPLEINELRIEAGSLTYVDRGPFDPLELTEIRATATNIRNVRDREREYPSQVQLRAHVFGTGRLSAVGAADFLMAPYPGVRGHVRLDRVALRYFAPLAERYSLRVRDGWIDAELDLEYGPRVSALHVSEIAIREIDADYVYPAQGEQEVRQDEAVGEAAAEPSQTVQLDRLRVTSGRLGFVNLATEPDYHVFLRPVQIRIENLSSELAAGAARATVTGELMGTGEARASASFRPERGGPDFDLTVEIVDTELPALNELLRAYGDVDVRAGLFSLYSELAVSEGRIDGYVKPLFRSLDVYDREQDSDQGPVQQLYEGLVGGLGGLLENDPRDEVATVADLSGPVDDPDASTWQVAIRLLQNAFFDSILPGFERETGRARS
jgi:hypothetical protein